MTFERVVNVGLGNVQEGKQVRECCRRPVNESRSLGDNLYFENVRYARNPTYNQTLFNAQQILNNK